MRPLLLALLTSACSGAAVAPAAAPIEQVATANGTRVVPWVTMPLQHLAAVCR